MTTYTRIGLIITLSTILAILIWTNVNQPDSIYEFALEEGLSNTKCPEAISQARLLAVANAERKIAERRAWLSDAHSESRQFKDMKFNTQAWYLFTPYFPCLASFVKEPRLERVALVPPTNTNLL